MEILFTAALYRKLLSKFTAADGDLETGMNLGMHRS